MKILKNKHIASFREYLLREERSAATTEKYLRDIRAFQAWLGKRVLNKETVLAYKNDLMARYAPTSVNSMLSAINSLFTFLEWYELKVKTVKIQRQLFASDEKELTRAEYERLLAAAQRKDPRLYLLMQTICSTGIRVSELRYITAEAVRRGRAEIHCKGKHRTVFLPDRLCKTLTKYLWEQKRTSGSVFVTKNGNPLDRSNIWAEMKKLCRAAGVAEKKVFPHNLRHLFARTYYSKQKDIVRLADILGHSSINTTRIYTMESGEIHRRQIQELGLLRC